MDGLLLQALTGQGHVGEDGFLRDRLVPLDDPRQIGHALKGAVYGDFWRYRVRDYRIVASIEDERVSILVVKIGHRREIYRD